MSLPGGRAGNGTGRIGGGGRKAGKFDRYALAVQSTLKQIMSQHPRLRSASFSGTLRIWADTTGRIERVSYSAGTGDEGIEEVIEGGAFNGGIIQGGLPQDMPMPIVIRTAGRRPITAASR
jgi:hypothetical protein